MSDILTARATPAEAAPPLTPRLRHHLMAQYRADLRRDEAQADALRATCATLYRQRDPDGARLRALLHRAAATRAALAEIGGAE